MEELVALWTATVYKYQAASRRRDAKFEPTREAMLEAESALRRWMTPTRDLSASDLTGCQKSAADTLQALHNAGIDAAIPMTHDWQPLMPEGFLKVYVRDLEGERLTRARQVVSHLQMTGLVHLILMEQASDKDVARIFAEEHLAWSDGQLIKRATLV